MKIPALLSLSDKTFTPLEEMRGIEKYIFYEELQLVNATIIIHDPRQITPKQRKFLYAMYYDIAVFSEGYCDNLSKTYWNNFFKQLLIENELLDEHISLSNCSMEEANILIDFVLEFVFRNNIPLRLETIKEYDDMERWQYMCLKYRKCCVCGKNAEIHHYNAIGIGHDRKKVDDSKHLKMALCRSHHQEIHSMARDEFCKKYHIKAIRLTENQIKELGI